MQMCRCALWRMSIRTGVLTKDEERSSLSSIIYVKAGVAQCECSGLQLLFAIEHNMFTGTTPKMQSRCQRHHSQRQGLPAIILRQKVARLSKRPLGYWVLVSLEYVHIPHYNDTHSGRSWLEDVCRHSKIDED